MQGVVAIDVSNQAKSVRGREFLHTQEYKENEQREKNEKGEKRRNKTKRKKTDAFLTKQKKRTYYKKKIAKQDYTQKQKQAIHLEAPYTQELHNRSGPPSPLPLLSHTLESKILKKNNGQIYRQVGRQTDIIYTRYLVHANMHVPGKVEGKTRFPRSSIQNPAPPPTPIN